jgi:hypothetical protein
MQKVEEAFGGDGYVYAIDCRDDYTVIYLLPNSTKCMH